MPFCAEYEGQSASLSLKKYKIYSTFLRVSYKICIFAVSKYDINVFKPLNY